jgi:hypothetical protein
VPRTMPDDPSYVPGQFCLLLRDFSLNDRNIPVFICRDLSSFNSKLLTIDQFFLISGTFVVDFVHLLG